MLNLLEHLRLARRYLKTHAPFVRRREYFLAQRRCEKITDAVTLEYRLARTARVDVIKPLADDAGVGEVCLFVTHAEQARLKAHVIHHVDCLVEHGFQVVLIINTDVESNSMELDPATIANTSALYIRENVGFDFAAWGHAYSLCNGFPHCNRLLLVNDSIVGPISKTDYTYLIDRLRASTADLVGLTEHFRPTWNLQSFFLAFNAQALSHEKVKQLFNNMLALPDKDTVISVYELALARQMRSLGLRCEALFPARFPDLRSGDDTIGRWSQLVDAGFPFVKGSIVRDPKHAKAVAAIVPAQFVSSIVEAQ